ncbi:hypothetical protein C8R46DRAFT_1300219 [Mycena filopes]|nr:hypothetical protein C8R46DRAFT_1300219 [Mycena filopes]
MGCRPFSSSTLDEPVFLFLSFVSLRLSFPSFQPLDELTTTLDPRPQNIDDGHNEHPPADDARPPLHTPRPPHPQHAQAREHPRRDPAPPRPPPLLLLPLPLTIQLRLEHIQHRLAPQRPHLRRRPPLLVLRPRRHRLALRLLQRQRPAIQIIDGRPAPHALPAPRRPAPPLLRLPRLPALDSPITKLTCTLGANVPPPRARLLVRARRAHAHGPVDARARRGETRPAALVVVQHPLEAAPREPVLLDGYWKHLRRLGPRLQRRGSA